MNDMTDTTEDSEVSRVSDDGCDGPPPARHDAVRAYALITPIRTRRARARYARVEILRLVGAFDARDWAHMLSRLLESGREF